MGSEQSAAAPQPVSLSQAIQAALQHHQSGRLAEAEALYRQILAVDPENADVLHLLGVLSHQTGKSYRAIDLISRAVNKNPADWGAYNNLGEAYRKLNRLGEAEKCYSRALDLKPDFTIACCNLGATRQALGRPLEAERSYRQALAIQPDHVEAHYNLGLILQMRGMLDEAVASFRKTCSLKPDFGDAYYNLGVILQGQGKLDLAEDAYRQTLLFSPDNARVYTNLGVVCQEQGNLDGAEAYYRRALELDPDNDKAHGNLGAVFLKQCKLDEAIISFTSALSCRHDNLEVYGYLLNLYAFTRAVSPESECAFSSVWERIALTEAERATAHARTFDYPTRNGRKLRIGVVSAEIGLHSVAEFLEPVLEQLDHNRCHVALYSTAAWSGERVERFKALADSFASLVGLSDSTAADRIRSDRIDILIDTTGHTNGCRLGIFAHRAAPVQCHYIGYFGTTGLTEMDWFIADEVLLPSSCDSHFRERIWRLPRFWEAYRGDRSLPESHWSPGPDGIIRLGSFNHLAKIRGETLHLWARVMNALPESILLLKAHRTADQGIQQRIRTELSRYGIAGERIEFTSWTPDWRSHMALYERLDIALDTIPLTSGTTAYDALWMGVPLVTLEGNWMGGRMTTSILTALGKPEWIARSADEYVSLVSALARDVEGRTALRQTQRSLMAASPLCDAQGLARKLEDAFEGMFDQWETRRESCLMEREELQAAGNFEKTPEVMEAISVPRAIQSALEHHQAGRHPQAEAVYQNILQIEPHHPDALHLLGVLASQTGQTERAVDLIKRAIHADPANPQYYNNLGNTLKTEGRVDDAIACYRKATDLKRDYVKAYYNLGITLQEQGRLDDALVAYRQVFMYQKDHSEALFNTGIVFQIQKKLDDAVTSYRQVLSFNPDHAEAHYNLGIVFNEQGKLAEAEASYHHAIAFNPGNVKALTNLATVLLEQGKLDESVATFKAALHYKPDYLEAYGGLLYLYSSSRIISHESEYAFAAAWETSALTEAERAAARTRTFGYPSRTGRKLRLGVVSAELGQHSVADFLEPVLEQLDRSRFHLTLFSTVDYAFLSGERAARFKALADSFISLVGLSDSMAAERIRSERIDVLIDTTGHTNGCRLGIFAHRAAPVQCHYIGYFGTTGLTEMDWFIGDGILLPCSCDSHFRERIWRLPRVWLSYRGDASLPESRWTPAPDGTVRLGSFNTLAKVRSETLHLWAQVMNALPESKLLLKDRKTADDATRQRIMTELSRYGISGERIEFAAWTADWRSHMELYDGVDIALDTIPLTSGTTAFDALWMGTPLIALEGDWMGGRMTASILTALGKPDWIARSEEDYAALVCALARDVEGRAALRKTQRCLMAKSQLCDAPGLARALEDAFETMSDQCQARQAVV